MKRHVVAAVAAITALAVLLRFSPAAPASSVVTRVSDIVPIVRRVSGTLSKALLMDAMDGMPTKRIVAVSFVSWHVRELALNLARGAAAVGMRPLVLVALDEKAYAWLNEQPLPGVIAVAHVPDAPPFVPNGIPAHSPELKAFVAYNSGKIREIASWGFEVLVIDADVAINRNPLPWLYEHARDADILMATNLLATSTSDGGLEALPYNSIPPFTPAIMFVAPTPAAAEFITALIDALHGDRHTGELDAIRLTLKRDFVPATVPPGRRLHTFGKTRVGALPSLLFCNGHVYFVQRLPQSYGLEPLMVHVSHSYGGLVGKLNTLREAMMLYDQPEYFGEAAGDATRFLSFRLSVPPDMLVPDSEVHWGELPAKHIALARLQVRQTLAAAGIAKATGRALIFPRYRCLCDRSTQQLDKCVSQGADRLRLPFFCPLDHLLTLSGWVKHGIGFREHSFLQNPKTAPVVVTSRMLVNVDIAVADHATGGRGHETGARDLHVSSAATAEQWAAMLAPYEDVRVIELSSVEGVFLGWDDAAENKAFHAGLSDLVGVWCCGGPDTIVPLLEPGLRFDLSRK